MYATINIQCENLEEIKLLSQALQLVGVKAHTETDIHIEPTAKLQEILPTITEEPAEANASAPTPATSNKRSHHKKVEATPVVAEVTPEAPQEAEIPEETTPAVDVAMCRALATKAIQKNLSNEVNAVVKGTGAASLSKIPENLLPDVYAKLKVLVGE